jgi:tetratricopeptide (TPR) repeat protein
MLAQAVASGQTRYRSRADRRARALYLQGDRHYAAARYARALAAFTKAYRLSKRELLLYNMANACERMGRLTEAIKHLETYSASIEDDPDELDRITARVRALRRELGDDPASMSEARPDEQPPAPASTPAAPPLTEAGKAPRGDAVVATSVTPHDSGRGRRIAGYSLLGVGAAGLATGVVFGVLALNSRQDAEDRCEAGFCTGEARGPQQQYRTRALAADIAFGAAAVSAAVGTYLVLTGYQKQSSERPSVSAGLTPGGVRVAVTHRF